MLAVPAVQSSHRSACWRSLPAAAQQLRLRSNGRSAPPSLPQRRADGGRLRRSGWPRAKFVIQLKSPADYAVPPHSHPTDEMVTVISGKVHYGMGDKIGR